MSPALCFPLFVRTAISDELEQLRADPAIIGEHHALGRGPVGGDSPSAPRQVSKKGGNGMLQRPGRVRKLTEAARGGKPLLLLPGEVAANLRVRLADLLPANNQ